ARRDSRWLPPSMRHPLGKPPRCGIRPDSPLDGGPPIAGAPRTAGRTQLIRPSKRDSLVHVAPFEPRARRRRATRPSCARLVTIVSSGTVLVVDDDEGTCELLQLLLTGEGYRVHVENSAAAALL